MEHVWGDYNNWLESEYIKYCIKCIPNQTPKSFNEWIHTEPTQTSNDDLPF